MNKERYSQSSPIAILVLIATGVMAFWLLSDGGRNSPELAAAARAAGRRPTGRPQLVSVDRLPEAPDSSNGEICEWVPASTNTSLFAELQQERLADPSSRPPSGNAGKPVDITRPPLRMIRDTDPIYTSIAVDTHFDEVILQDANLFGIKVFNRLDNTAPGARLTEPKRVIEGPNTHIQFNCGLYVDQKTGDIYSVEEDTGDRMIVFPHDAKGNVEPARELKIPHRGFAIAVDEEKQEIYITVQYPPKVVAFRKAASGDENPLRVLEGPHTGLIDVHGVAVDVKNHLLFVNNHGNESDINVPGSGKFHSPSITVYPLDANGDTPPLRVIQGPKTRLNWPAAMYVNLESGDLYVANDVDNSVLVFRETDQGDAEPTRILKGPKTGIKNPTGVYLDTVHKELWVSSMGKAAASVYPLMANGDVAPLRIIRSAPLDKVSLEFSKPGAVAYDSKREEILVPN